MTRNAPLVLAAAGIIGMLTAVFGMWALVDAASFAHTVRFPEATHFVHDVGAFQLGLGVGLLLAMVWRDALAVTLAGFLVGNTAHTVNHFLDGDLGGLGWEQWLLAALSVFVAAALVVRLRDLGWVIGDVRPAAVETLVPFVRQKTVAITTYRRDGTPSTSPVSIAVDGDRAYFRSFEKAWKSRRIRNNSQVEIAPSTARGRPTGPAVSFTARRLNGAENACAAHLLRRKYPVLHGVLVPATHRMARAKTGRTVHFVLTLR